jgi:hypothetical protein
MGFNRSALVAGVILHELGMPGPDVVSRLRARRPGALFNECFAAYLEQLPKQGTFEEQLLTRAAMRNGAAGL